MGWAAALNRMTARVRDTFPASVVYDPDGAAVALIGIFEEAAERIEFSEDGAPVSTTAIMLDLRLTDLGLTPKSRDEVTVAEQQTDDTYGTATRYRVTAVEPDGAGSVSLILTKKAT